MSATETPEAIGHDEAAVRRRTAVSLYVALVCAAAAGVSVAAALDEPAPFTLNLVAFMILATLTDLREIKLPWVGDVTLSFVPVLACLIALGLWPAMAVAAVSGITAAWVTRDPVKIAFNVGNYVVSTYLAGLLYLALTPEGGAFMTKVLPTFGATIVDFLAHTALLAGVIALSTQDGGAVRVWRRNYQWALPGYLAGSTLALLVAALYLWLGVPGMLLGMPPLYLIYYSYDIYVKRAKEKVTFDAERDSFHKELAASVDAARRAARGPAQGGGRDRARAPHPDRPPPRHDPRGARDRRWSSASSSSARWAATTTTTSPSATGASASSAATSWARGSPRRSSWRWRARCCTTPSPPASAPGTCWRRSTTGSRATSRGSACPTSSPWPSPCTTPSDRSLVVAGGGHNPVLVAGRDGLREVPSRGAALGVRTGLRFPEDTLVLEAGATVALYTDGLTEARDAEGSLFGLERLERSLERCQDAPVRDTLDCVWGDIVAFRGHGSRTDDATLLLVRLL